MSRPTRPIRAGASIQIAAIVLPVLVLSGCGSDRTDRTSPDYLSQSPILTSEEGIGVLDAPLYLSVVIENGCVLLDDYESPREPVFGVWPPGTNYDSDRETIRTASGIELRDGDLFDSGGGFLNDGTRIKAVADPASMTERALDCATGDEFWFVSYPPEPK